ncbi:MAG: response regulator transcription factor [Planctomycetaceae bacterium]|nr:response regulator transcription factor [Planctomycetaceae bacterium]
MKILIVEDEIAIAEGLRFNFEQEGYDVQVYGDGPSALEFVESHDDGIDLVVLDLMLPEMSGYEICSKIRETNADVPIMVLSARTLSEDKTRAFDCGVDQYMTKPFALPELLSRARNLLERRRRQQGRPAASTATTDRVKIGNAEVNFRTFEISVDGQVQQLTTTEVQLLQYFLEHEGAVLSRQRILKDVWEQTADISTRTVDNFVMRLRRYVEDDPAQPRHFLSVRGTGYRFLRAENDAISDSE